MERSQTRRSGRLVARAAALFALALAGGTPARAQDTGEPLRVTAAEENFRAAPGGTRLAVLMRDAPLRGGASRGQWREATLEGWIRADRVTATTRDGFDLAVASGGATLHRAPGGPVVARGMGGFLLNQVERRGEWVRVRRTAWIWGPSTGAPAVAAAPGASPPVAAAGTPDVAAPPSQRTLHAAPSGAALGTLAPTAELEVIGREGEWARVRVEGWVRLPPGADENPNAPLHNLSLQALRSDPDRYRGRTVAWRVQFVSVQRADSLRSDLQPGEPYMLARDPGGEPGFVYIAVPDDLLARVRRVVPLQHLEVVARVRTGRSAVMGHPVLELVRLGSSSNP